MKRVKIKRTVKVAEGDVFAVPLPDGGYGRVVVSRKDRSGGVFGYFFGPRYESVPELGDIRELRADGALLREICSDLGIQEKSWPFLGRLELWDRTQWPLPQFGRIADEALGIAYIDTYVNDDLDKLPVQRRCTPEEARRHLSSGISGDRAAAIALAMKLRGEEPPW